MHNTVGSLLSILAITLWWARVHPRDNVDAYRVAFVSIFALLPLCAQPYVQFYLLSLDQKRWVFETSVAAVLLPAMVLTSFPPVRRIRMPYAIALFVAVFGAVAVRWNYDTELKTWLADAAGVFSGPSPIQLPPASGGVEFVHANGGYALRVPSDWRRSELNSELADWKFAYFRRMDGNKTQLELRPHCVHGAPHGAGTRLSVLQADKRRDGTTDSIRCYRWQQSFRACLLKERRRSIAGELVESRVWLAEDEQTLQYISLDFLIHAWTQDVERQIEEVVASVKLVTLPKPIPFCPGISAWM
jgi:hypothetical protein